MYLIQVVLTEKRSCFSLGNFSFLTCKPKLNQWRIRDKKKSRWGWGRREEIEGRQRETIKTKNVYISHKFVYLESMIHLRWGNWGVSRLPSLTPPLNPPLSTAVICPSCCVKSILSNMYREVILLYLFLSQGIPSNIISCWQGFFFQLGMIYYFTIPKYQVLPQENFDVRLLTVYL